MKKKLLRNIAFGLAAVTCGGLACVCGILAKANASSEAVIPETAYLGQTIQLPERTLDYNGQDIKSSVLITVANSAARSRQLLPQPFFPLKFCVTTPKKTQVCEFLSFKR